jgi:cytochrome c553
MKLQSILFILAALAAGQATAAGNPAEGAKKNTLCIGCHGIADYKTAFPHVYHVPKISGQHAAYLVKALQAYKTGERKHGSMRAVAGSLTDQDMEDLAAYYATLK